MTDSFGFLVVTFIIILGFEAVNGWTDAPNSIATVISTRVLAPMTAVAMAAFFNLVGALSGTAVATTIGKGLVDQELVGLDTIAAAAAAVIIWSTAAWYFGLPTSESHGIVSGLAGAAVATSGGLDVLQWEGWRKVFTGLGLAVVAGFLGGFLVMVAVLWLFRRVAPALVRRLFAVLQVVSSAFMAFSHGTADGQKAMGVMALAIAVYEKTPPEEFAVPLWIILLAAGTMSVSTGLGGWRIIRTLGMKVTHLDTPQGFSAEAAAATTITISAHLGIPVSTTHAIGSAIMGVGATRRLSAVRWGVAYNIVGAWVLTFPACFGLGWVIAWLIP